MMESQDSYYKNNYEKILNAGAVGLVSKIVHKSMEFGFKSKNFENVLELGAGNGQHFDHVKHKFKNYLETDIRFENLPKREFENRSDSFKVSGMRLNAEDLSIFSDNSFDRIIVSCLIVHLQNPEMALLEWKRVCKPGGVITIYLPCEPGVFLRGLRYLTTVQKARKLGVNHLDFHYREHITFFVRIWTLLKSVFDDSVIERRFYPFHIPSWNLNLWAIIQITKK